MNGKKLDDEELEQIIESGESESIFRSAVVDAGRGQVSAQTMDNNCYSRFTYFYHDGIRSFA